MDSLGRPALKMAQQKEGAETGELPSPNQAPTLPCTCFLYTLPAGSRVK